MWSCWRHRSSSRKIRSRSWFSCSTGRCTSPRSASEPCDDYRHQDHLHLHLWKPGGISSPVRRGTHSLPGFRLAQRDWARRAWRDRVAVLHRAAELIQERKYDLAAIMSLEVGKSRLEAMGDAEESADLIDYYCAQVEEADGFVRPMGRITPAERNTDVLRPYGVFA